MTTRTKNWDATVWSHRWLRWKDDVCGTCGKEFGKHYGSGERIDDTWCDKGKTRPWTDREPVQEPKTVKPDSLWNGTCIRCGKGTYQGAWKLEHDGECR